MLIDQQHTSLYQRIVTVIDGLYEKGGNSRPVKYRLAEYGSSNQVSKLQADNRDNGNHRIADYMLSDDFAARQPFCTQRPDGFRRHRVQH